MGAILTAFIGIFGGLIGHADASKNGTDTKYHNGYLASDIAVSQNNGLDSGLIAPHSGSAFTNFIGCNNGRSSSCGGETITTIIMGYCNDFGNHESVLLTSIDTTATITIGIKFKGVLTALITGGIENIFAGASTPDITAIENIIKGDLKEQGCHETKIY